MYFQTITLSGNQDRPVELSQKMENALNNYQKYGIANPTNPARMVELGRTPLPKPREIKHMTSSQVVINMTIWQTVVLCCEGDLSEVY